MTEEKIQSAMQIILHAGDARVNNDLALKALAEFNIVKAKEEHSKAQENITKAHRIQTDAIQDETRGISSEYSLLFAHAQDTLMTINSEILVTKRLILMTEAIDNRFRALENK